MAVKRLTRSDFARIKSGQNRRFNGRFFTLSVTTGSSENGLAEPKFTFVVSKKTAVHAADRNRIKRQAREAARVLLKDQTKPTFFVFYAKKESLHASYPDIVSDIHSLIARI